MHEHIYLTLVICWLNVCFYKIVGIYKKISMSFNPRIECRASHLIFDVSANVYHALNMPKNFIPKVLRTSL